tara:strand:+ start:95 stop:415 length:321 start_codon:yes stop_codon:yes gene_type:complete
MENENINLKTQYKQVKKSLIDVIKYINENNIDLETDIKSNMKIIIDLWKQQKKQHIFHLEFYINMKQYHSYINGNIDNEVLMSKWNIYIQNISNFRIQLMKYEHNR